MKYIGKLFIATALMFSSLTMTSCSEDYLNTAPTGSVGTDAVFATTESCYQALNGIARIMTTQYSYFGQGFCGENGVWWIYENYPDQNFLYNYYASGWYVIFNMLYMDRTTSSYNAYAWYYCYGIISNANSIIANIDAAEGTDDDKAFIKASALSFRAYAYEKLVRYYCYRWADSSNGSSQGVVLRLDESTGDLPYSTLGEVYDQIYADLDEAISLFSSSSFVRDATEIWIPNINVAHAVYARAAIAKQDYSTALSHATSAKSGYDLMSVSDYQSGFCEPTSEWIMGSFGDSTENNWYYSFGVMFAANGYYSTASVTGGGQANLSMFETIPDTDARKALFITPDKFSYDFTSSANVNQTYGYVAGDDLWDEVYEYVDEMAISGYSAPYQSGYIYAGSNLKFYVIETPGIGYLPMIRTSEMVLLEAEANYFLGNEAGARASLVELNATSGRDASYTTSNTGEALFEEIVAYRGLELWGEGTTWSDYKRWNRPITRAEDSFANGGNVSASVAVDIATDSYNQWTWGIPQNETNYNGALTDEEAE